MVQRPGHTTLAAIARRLEACGYRPSRADLGRSAPCELSPQNWPRSGISLRRGSPTTPVASATWSRPEGVGASLVAVILRSIWCRPTGAGLALERRDLRRVIAKAVRLIGILKIFVSKW
jgi:hypothetical protein